MTYSLSEQRVLELLGECLAASDTTENVRVSKGIVANYAIDLNKLELAKPEIASMLLQLDDSFMTGKGKGGGWSFLQACNDRRGRQWADLHSAMEALFVLGMAADMADCLLPREAWDALPGGMPYYSVRENTCETWARRFKVAA